jgi:hypothetical protein
MSKVRQGKAVRRLWTGEASDLDLLRAGRDPRQTHFAFYVEPDPFTGSVEPGKKEPDHVTGFDERVHEAVCLAGACA